MLTLRDREILETLTRRVRVLSAAQIARAWWPDATNSRRAALTRLRALTRENYVRSDQALVHPELPLTAPVFSWAPADEAPPLGQIAYRLQTRWTGTASPENVFVISRQAAAEFGGYPSPALRVDEITHDLHLATVYLWYRLTAPELADAWVGERVIRRTRHVQKGPIPDAMIRTASSVRLVEFGGAYSKRRIQIFHDHCARHGLAYELW